MKLKPCPFCGGEVRIQLTDSEGNWKDESYLEEPYSGVSYVIVHDETMAKGICPIATDESDEKSQGMWIYPTEENAIEDWNRRAHTDKVVGQIHKYFKGEIDSLNGEEPWGILKHNKAVCEIVKRGGIDETD